MTDSEHLEAIMNRAYQYDWRPPGFEREQDFNYRAEGRGDTLRVLVQSGINHSTDIHEDRATVFGVHALLYGHGLHLLKAAIGERLDGESVLLTGEGVEGTAYSLRLNSVQYRLVAQSAIAKPTTSDQLAHIFDHLRDARIPPMSSIKAARDEEGQVDTTSTGHEFDRQLTLG